MWKPWLSERWPLHVQPMWNAVVLFRGVPAEGLASAQTHVQKIAASRAGRAAPSAPAPAPAPRAFLEMRGPNPFASFQSAPFVMPASERYLPKVVRGSEVLQEVSPNTWQTVNSIGATTQGLGYRNSKNLNALHHADDIRDRLVFWGDSVQGVDEGDGWVRAI